MRLTGQCVLAVIAVSGCAAPEDVGASQTDVSSELTSTATDLNIARGGSIDVSLWFGRSNPAPDSLLSFEARVKANIHSQRRTDCQIEVLSPDCKLIRCNGPYYGGQLPSDVDTGQIRVTATSTPGALNLTPDARTHQYTPGTVESDFYDRNAPVKPYVGPGDRVRVESGGGAIPAVGVSVEVASAIVVQPNRIFNRDAYVSWPKYAVFDRSQDLVTTWSGGSVGNVEVGILAQQMDWNVPAHSTAVSLECVVPSSRGEIAIPSSWLMRLPTGNPDQEFYGSAWVRPSNRGTAVLPSPEGYAVVDVNVTSFVALDSEPNQQACHQTRFAIQ